MRLLLAIQNIEAYHIYAIGQLPMIHKDPFDRLLIAQSMSEKMRLISKDSIFKNYPNLHLIW